MATTRDIPAGKPAGMPAEVWSDHISTLVEIRSAVDRLDGVQHRTLELTDAGDVVGSVTTDPDTVLTPLCEAVASAERPPVEFVLIRPATLGPPVYEEVRVIGTCVVFRSDRES